MSTTHAVAAADFAALAGGLGDAGVITALRRGQHSKRMVQLRALLDAAAQAGLDDVVQPGLALLTETQRTAPGAAAVAGLFRHPPVGEWLAHCLRQLCGRDPDRARLAADLGHLSAVAAAAALRAGTEFTITVPSRAGTVMFPTLGLARLPGLGPGQPATVSGRAGGPATAEGAGARLVIPARPTSAAPGWVPLRSVELSAAGHHLGVFLDDLDPFRDCHGSATAEPLDSGSAERWRDLLDAAWSLLAQSHPGYAAGIGAGLTAVVPLRPRPGRGLTATSPDSFGSCMMSEPADPVALAVGLVHEFQHAKLGALMDLVPLHTANATPRYYAPWRDDPRPLGGLLHGTYAFLAVADFWRVQRAVMPPREARFAHFEFARRREQVQHAVSTLQSSGQLTPPGASLVAAIGDRLRGWAAEDAPAAAAAARAAIADHRITWRLRHARPARERVDRIVAAWRAASGPAAVPGPRDEATPPEICPAAGPFRDSGRLELLSLRVREPGRFAQLSSRPAELGAVIPAASAADVAYARGDLDAAAAGYERMLAAEPGSVTAWGGLVLIARSRDSGRAGPLIDEPELIRAVYQRLRAGRAPAVRPADLAGWLGSQGRRLDVELQSVQGPD
jgi:HEXXH motif-containing protein